MEMKKKTTVDGVGIGSILPPGSYKVDGEVMLLRVRLDGLPLVCLIDQDRRVKEILSATAEVEAAQPKNHGDVAYDGRRSGESSPCPQQAAELQKHAGNVRLLAEKFAALLQRYAADGRACLRKMAPVLDRGNVRLLCEYAEGGAPRLKAYLVRELFKCTVREDRGFKVLLLLSHVIAMGGDGQSERLEAMSLDQQKNLLREFMDFLNVAGHKRIDPRIFQEIHEKFNENEYANLNRGGVGFFIKPLYDQEMKELRTDVRNESNANYIEQLFLNAGREPLDFLYENTLAYLKALAIVRLYAKSNHKERGGEGKTVEHILRDLIAFRPASVKAAGPAQARTA